MREDCTLQIQCLTPNVIYKADIHCDTNSYYKFYFRVAQIPFKDRFRNYNWYFNHKQYIKISELFKYIWLLKDAGIPYTISWLIILKVKGSTKINYCQLRFTEKNHLIEYFNDIWLLNKKSEFINAYRHQRKLLVKTLKRIDSMNWKNIKEFVNLMYIFFIFSTK